MRLAYLHIFVRRGRRSNTDICFLIQEAQNIAVYGDKMLGKMELFRRIVVFQLLIHSRLRKLRVEMAHFKKYSSFSEKRYAFVREKWQISVQPLHNIIILIGSKN